MVHMFLCVCVCVCVCAASYITYLSLDNGYRLQSSQLQLSTIIAMPSKYQDRDMKLGFVPLRSA